MREFYYKYLKWLGEDKDNNREVVVSTRIRIARNLEDFVFPSQLLESQRKRILNKVEWVYKNETRFSEYDFLKLEKLPNIVLDALVEKHLISSDHLENIRGAGLLVDKSGKLSVMINEEDHFRLQVLSSGLELKESWKKLLSLEEIFSDYFKFAFDDKFGYLTSCITNLGCGVRISFVVHLPALTYSGKIKDFLKKLRSNKILIRGIYGERSKPIAGFYQITSRSSLGIAEEELIEKMEKVARKIIDEEVIVREFLFREKRRYVEDIVARAYGILSNARYLNSLEAINLLSDLRFGIYFKMLDISMKVLDLLMILILPGHLQTKYGRGMDPEERDGVRADLLRVFLKNYKINQGGVI
ncbi:McsB [Dictyoglomus thermophilum]|uniref:McsB n=2 Tax=Dictyoglomus thermophilum TaxID=14 RepID=B5YF82_DICT6|nr:McsB [Dictyoglomus thermophilum]ACI20106.1 McsB [Dictyoglomus thermophilum H-6-12]MCX7719893.1 ATP--guanido phosphotransferase [Dictyoglomus thermophilum]TYT22658.1 ATP--guanido phosphotransferase [Dictyoglomus thermophilum]